MATTGAAGPPLAPAAPMITQVNQGDREVFFDAQSVSTSSQNLITAQVDPGQPQVVGLSTLTNPVVTDQHLSARLTHFDPEQFDLASISHLTRLLTALIAGAGVGGLRRQQIIARMSATLAGTHFLDLDGFWGKLFALPRAPQETLPVTVSGTPIDPATDVTDSATWDIAASRDGRYRSRIEQLAKGFAHGGTSDGIRLAAQAILNTDVDLVESWLYADYATRGSVGFTGRSWTSVGAQYSTWAQLAGANWGNTATGVQVVNQSPLGNRGEVTIVAGRQVTQAERFQLHNVLDRLAPAGVMVTVSEVPFVATDDVAVRGVHADSTDWDVVSLVRQQQSIDTGDVDLYPFGSDSESARPAFGRYSGERWSYNSRVAGVNCYAVSAQGVLQHDIDYDTVTYTDGTSHDYRPGDALVDSRRMALARSTREGVLTSFPWAVAH